MSGYAVVLFNKWRGGKYVAAVPDRWLIVKDGGLFCSFPKYHAAKMIEQQAPVEPSWKLYPVKRLSKKKITTYEAAVQKESEARYTSGVDSNSESAAETDSEKHASQKKIRRVGDVSTKECLDRIEKLKNQIQEVVQPTSAPITPSNQLANGTFQNVSTGSTISEASSVLNSFNSFSQINSILRSSTCSSPNSSTNQQNTTGFIPISQPTTLISSSPSPSTITTSSQVITMSSPQSAPNLNSFNSFSQINSILRSSTCSSPNSSTNQQNTTGFIPISQPTTLISSSPSPSTITTISQVITMSSPQSAPNLQSSRNPPSPSTYNTLLDVPSSVIFRQSMSALSGDIVEHITPSQASWAIPDPPSTTNHTGSLLTGVECQNTPLGLPYSPTAEPHMCLPLQGAQSINLPSRLALNQKSLHEKVDKLMATVDEIKERMSQLQEFFENHASGANARNASADDISLEDFHLPVDSDSSMDELSQLLNDKTKRAQLKRLLGQLCGRDISRGIPRMMKGCVTYQMASKYTLLGRHRSKRNFSALPLYRVITQTAIRSFKECNVELANEYIGTFLRHAPEKPGCPKHKEKRPRSLQPSPNVYEDDDSSED